MSIHSRRVVFHFGFFEIKVFRLVVRNADLHLVRGRISDAISGCLRSTRGPRKGITLF